MADISCMSFNILACDTHDSGYELPETRIRHVVATIKAENPDLLGVQEACNLSCENAETKRCRGFDWCAPLIAAMEKLGYASRALREEEGFMLPRQSIGCGLIIFYKKDRFELTESGGYNYKHDVGRYYQWVRLNDTKFDREVLFTNTHFSIDQKVGKNRIAIAGNAFRTVQATKLFNFWFNNCEPNTALFATGDYNSQFHNEPHRILTYDRFRPSFLIAEEGDERGTMNCRKLACTIDFTYVNPTAQTVKKYYPVVKVYKSGYDCKLAGYASDHRATMTFCDYNPIVEDSE